MCGRCAKEGMFIPKKKKPSASTEPNSIPQEPQPSIELLPTPVLNSVLLALQMTPEEILIKPDDIETTSSQTTTTTN